MKGKLLTLSLLLSSSVACFNTALADSKLLSDTIPYPFYSVHKTSEGKSNKLMVLNSGIAALEKRLEMIKSAKNNIEVEYFIYGTDTSSRLFTQELVKAAKRGVTVRILIDKSAAVFEFDAYYAKALKEENIEVKYYNAAPLLQFSTINFRNHRKLLSVDDKIAITGGRNIEDDYFDISPEFNFIDRDVYIEGPMAKTMRESFDLFFVSDVTVLPDFPTRPVDRVMKTIKRAGGKIKFRRMVDNSKAVNAYLARTNKAQDLITISADDIKNRKRVAELADPILDKKSLNVCPELTFSTDRPGGTFWRRLVDDYSDDYRFLRKTLFDKVGAVDKKVLISSPYMINNGYSRDLMGSILDRGVDLDLYTNSLASTDAVYVAANLYKDVIGWVDMNVDVYIHDGKYMDVATNKTFSPGVKNAKWGTHSKSHIYYDSNYTEVMIGTYNIDNRSNHYNTEMAIFCKGSDAITKEVEASIDYRMKNGYKVNPDFSATDKDGNTVSVMGANKDDKMLMYLIALPSWLLKPLL